ncbi:hypothetical protein LDENG_00288570 [Lucifuga dentata]|nr:hypothetical protein LDENG_00288570 [Lucifuga dentata]
MSSPLSMLKKTKRVPLQGPPNQQRRKETVPFRRDMLSEFKETLQTDDSTDLSPSSSTHTQPSDARCTSNPMTSRKKGAPPSDFELMSAMMQRLTQLEAKVKSQAQEIERRDIKISVLEERLRLLKKSENAHDLSDRDDLVRRCNKLQTQVYEMECFLSDYGLIWVGDGESCDAACQSEAAAAEYVQTHSSDGELQQPGRNFHMNFDLVLQNIKELNILAGDGESFVKSTATGAQLAQKDPIQLRLYRNGIVMFDGPFRSYQEQSTQQCMQDLMDGYFPSELQQRFPDGVAFEVHDRRDEEFIIRQPWAHFAVQRQPVHGARQKSSNAIISEIPGKKLSMNQFLNRLPKVVVKAGRVIAIRESVKQTLQCSSDAHNSNSVSLVNTPALQAMKERQQIFASDRPSSACEVATLKLKSEDGNHTYILKMWFSETIGHLRQYLDEHRGGSIPGYDIISVHPQRTYTDDHQTLLSCGLLTNTTLLLRMKQNTHSLTDQAK